MQIHYNPLMYRHTHTHTYTYFVNLNNPANIRICVRIIELQINIKILNLYPINTLNNSVYFLFFVLENYVMRVPIFFTNVTIVV